MKNEYNNNSKVKEKTTLSPQDRRGSDYGTKGNEDEDYEGISEKLPYPKSVFFIIANEFCERFSYYGMKTVLSFYLKNALEYTEDRSTVIYHVFSMFCYFTPLLGAFIADSLLGKFRTILYLSIVYAAGNIVLSLAATPPIHLPAKEFSMIGLALIALGTGGIKPCVSAFGGEQFSLPQQARQLSTYFSIFYFSINAGSLLSTLITPYFRKDVTCFGDDTCYPLAFGVPAALMITSLVVFIIGRPWYKVKQPEGNITAEVAKCMSHAIREKSKSNVKKEHWLDHAAGKYDHELIESIKRLLKILILYLPLPVFWALFDQQGSRWTFQAARMNGEFFGYRMKPDQMQVLNPFLILAFIPLFDQVIYPNLAKIGLLKKPLQRLTMGGILAGAAFIISGFLELQLEPTYAVKLAAGESHLNFVNGLNCTVHMELGESKGDIGPLGQHIIERIKAAEHSARFSTSGEGCNLDPFTLGFKTGSKEARSYMISKNGNTLSVKAADHLDHLEKDGDGDSLLKIVFVGFEGVRNDTQLYFKREGEYVKIREQPEDVEGGDGHKPKAVERPAIPVTGMDSKFYKLLPNEHTVELSIPAVESQNINQKTVTIGTITPRQGGNYLYVLEKKDEDNYEIVEHIITKPNSIHMGWIIPQFVVITVGEVMFSVTGLEFSFSQAPASMKSVLQAAWLLTVAFGNVIVVFIAEIKIFDEQSKEFFLYAGLMFVDMIVFAILAYFYKPMDVKEKDEDKPNNMEMRESGMDNEGYRDP